MSRDKIKPKHLKAFHRHTQALCDLLEEIRKDCPEANYYLAMECLCLMDGDSHDEKGRGRLDRIVVSRDLGFPCAGGDW